jgi:hypothetical protein
MSELWPKTKQNLAIFRYTIVTAHFVPVVPDTDAFGCGVCRLGHGSRNRYVAET